MRILSLLAAASAVAVLGGCATATGPQAANDVPTPLDAWQREVKVSAIPQVLKLAPHPGGLSPNQVNALDGFASAFARAEAREVTIRAPGGGPTAKGGSRVAWEARERLSTSGVPFDRIRLELYDSGGDPGAPVMISYNQYVAEVPSCGVWDNLSRSGDNRVYSNFGCAVTANMAAQVANPEDLLGPRDMDPADAQARGTMFEKFRKGEATGSGRDEKASGSVSQVVN